MKNANATVTIRYEVGLVDQSGITFSPDRYSQYFDRQRMFDQGVIHEVYGQKQAIRHAKELLDNGATTGPLMVRRVITTTEDIKLIPDPADQISDDLREQVMCEVEKQLIHAGTEFAVADDAGPEAQLIHRQIAAEQVIKYELNDVPVSVINADMIHDKVHLYIASRPAAFRLKKAGSYDQQLGRTMRPKDIDLDSLAGMVMNELSVRLRAERKRLDLEAWDAHTQEQALERAVAMLVLDQKEVLMADPTPTGASRAVSIFMQCNPDHFERYGLD